MMKNTVYFCIKTNLKIKIKNLYMRNNLDNECLICFDNLVNDCMKCSRCKIKIHCSCHEIWHNINDRCPHCFAKNSFRNTSFIARILSFFDL